jgi:HD-GYP domain-containing protein (c-di-GMP phosphodiesterase class II)
MASENLRRVPVEYLYEGMEVTEDIFSSDGRRLLLPSGTFLNEDLLAKIKANSATGYIYVTSSTYKVLVENLNRNMVADQAITVNKKLEEETGYATAMDETTDLLKEIASTAVVPEESVYSVCDAIAHNVKLSEPGVIFDLINALAPVDEYLQRHVMNVGMLNGLIGRWMGFSKEEVDNLVLIGLLHDCGKAIIPLEILNAPRRLTHVEFEVMKMHTVYSYKMMASFPEPIRLGALYHHEKMNGNGYPNCLSGESLPKAARITSVSDIYDAMVSRRVYKNPATPFAVISKLRDLRGSDLDPKLVDLFVEKMPGELIGKSVLLSNGRVGTVKSINPKDIEHPVIQLDGMTIKSGKDIHCVSMYSMDS